MQISAEVPVVVSPGLAAALLRVGSRLHERSRETDTFTALARRSFNHPSYKPQTRLLSSAAPSLSGATTGSHF